MGWQHSTSGDGTSRVHGDALEKGDSYTVRAYAPDPTKRQMRRSEPTYPGNYSQYTRFQLPTAGDDATEGTGRAGDASRDAAVSLRQQLQVPLAGDAFTGEANADEVLRRSRYGDMYRLALDWTASAETNYDRVKAIEANLQEDYVYAERVPTRPIPLNGFLFDDRRGYCQQFSGTMALMLRMLGIPARVAAGFSPGSYNRDTREFRVRDLDAHSWVEVYFTGIGWVPFDPTPTASPAESQSGGLAATSAASADAGEVSSRQPRFCLRARHRHRGDDRRRRRFGLGGAHADPGGAGQPRRGGLVRRSAGASPSPPDPRAARGGPAGRAPPGARPPRVEAAGGNHTARPGAAPAALRGAALGRLRAPAARASLRPARA